MRGIFILAIHLLTPKHFGARVRVTLVLHTRDSALTHRPHVHGNVPAGGLAANGERCVACETGDWEQRRRVESGIGLCPPEEAIEPAEVADAALVLALLRAVFGKDDLAGGVVVVMLRDGMMAALGTHAIPKARLNP